MMLRVHSYMTKAPHWIAPDETLSTAKAKMEALAVRHLPVVRDGELVGVLSSRDLFLLDALNERSLRLMKVRDVMTDEPYAIAEDTPIFKVALEMAKRRIGSAVVIENSHVVGLFTTTDALRALADLTRPEQQPPAV